jgi:pectate lyase
MPQAGTGNVLTFGGSAGRAGASSGGSPSIGSPQSAGTSAAGSSPSPSSGGTGGTGGTGGAPSNVPSAGTPGAGSPSAGSPGAQSGGNASNASGGANGGSAGRGSTGNAGNAGAGNAGNAGNAGSGPQGCANELEGWAAQSGDSVATTTGGGKATPVRPANAEELAELAGDATPRVIEISGTFAVPRLQIASNKTLIGVGANATINGGLRVRGKSDAPVSNVIVRNLRVNGATSDVDGDAVQIYFAHHVWIDHVEIWDGPDGNLDIVHGSNWVTVSWSKFRYTEAAPDPEHKFASLIGHSDDNASEDTNRLKVTMHHNYWAEGIIERMPRVRFGQVHVFNNYFAARGNNYCVRAGRGASLLVEANVFEGVDSPHEFNSDEDRTTAHITSRDNVYTNVTGTQVTGGEGTPFTNPPYTANLDAASSVAARVRACAGPR